ncbi:MAG: SDR family oxidoreductase [Armatimonadota bacterium]|nr:SDR family oxidoreductase [Armatimonadota bacterium]
MAQERRILLVTGASRGIGRATALAAAAQGMDLVLVARRDADGLHATAEQARACGVRATTVLADVSLPVDVERIAGHVEREHGRLDALVNNAGIASQRGLTEVSLAEWQETLAVNLTGPFLVVRACLPLLRQGHDPAVVNVASIAGRIGGRVGPHYAASKGGLIALTKYLALHLRNEGIRVNCVAPDLTDTDMPRRLGLVPEPYGGEQAPQLGRAEDVAEVIVFLCRPGNRFLTGECIHLTGGRQYYG